MELSSKIKSLVKWIYIAQFFPVFVFAQVLAMSSGLNVGIFPVK